MQAPTAVPVTSNDTVVFAILLHVILQSSKSFFMVFLLQMEQKQRRDLLYAEVEIIEGAQQVRIPYASSPRRENTNYTSINEESTRALLQTCHARQGFR